MIRHWIEFVLAGLGFVALGAAIVLTIFAAGVWILRGLCRLYEWNVARLEARADRERQDLE